MPSKPRASTRHAGPEVTGNRQLTLGECLAVSRYGQHYVDPASGTVSLQELMLFIDTIGVCTTCGWSKPVHDAGSDDDVSLGVCPQYTRRL